MFLAPFGRSGGLYAAGAGAGGVVLGHGRVVVLVDRVVVGQRAGDGAGQSGCAVNGAGVLGVRRNLPLDGVGFEVEDGVTARAAEVGHGAHVWREGDRHADGFERWGCRRAGVCGAKGEGGDRVARVASGVGERGWAGRGCALLFGGAWEVGVEGDFCFKV